MVLPLSKAAKPKAAKTPCPTDCPNYENGYCGDHHEMERSRAVGMAFIKYSAFSIPVVLVALIGVLTFLSSEVDNVEGQVMAVEDKIEVHISGSNDKLDQIHHSVMTMEFNLRHDFESRGEEYMELKYMEEY